MNGSIKILLIAIMIFPHILIGQNHYYKFEHLSIEQGLSQSVINCMLQDSYGYMWFGTQDGLNRYDGYSFKSYKHDPTDTTSISGNWIYSITEDKEGNIWIGTRSGLNKFNRFENKFQRFFHDPGNDNSISDNYVHGVFIDKEGKLWIKASDVLNKYDIEEQKFSQYNYYVDPLNSYSRNRNFPILQDSQGKLWFGTPDGLNYVNLETNTIHRVFKKNELATSLSDNYITALAQLNDSILLVGTYNGLNVFNINRLEVIRKLYASDKRNSITNNSIVSIYVDIEKMVWIGTDEGLNQWNTVNNEIKNYTYNIDNPEGLSSDIILSIFEDDSHNLWIGTEGGGLNKVDLKPPRFGLYRKSSSENSVPFSNNQISSILIDDFDKLWIGTYGYGLNIYDRENSRVKIISTESKPQKLIDNWVHALYRDSKGLIWIGTRQGINIYSQAGRKFYNLKNYYPFTKELELRNNRIYMIMEDSKRNVWISTDLGLYRINWFTEEVRIFNFNTIENTNSSGGNKVFSLLEDKDGDVWIGTLNGLIKYAPEKNIFLTYRSSIHSKNTISHNTIYSLFQDSEDYIWIGTLSGLNRFNKKENEFLYISEKDGLPNNLIYTIEEDDIGYIWVSTDRGLARIDKETFDIRSFDIDDGMQGYEFNFGTSFKDKNGELFFGGQNGVNHFYGDSVYLNKYEPPLVINGIQVISRNNPRYINYNYKSNIVLTHKDYHINIEFASLDYTSAKRNVYKYKMSGLDDEWITIGNQNFVSFSNLFPGEYKFSIMGTNSDGVWCENAVSIPIYVRPPFWKTNLAVSFYIILIILLIYTYIEFRTKSLKLSNQILREKEIAAIKIAAQKEELTVKNKNITDSLNYAKRIQQALFPSEVKLKSLLPNSFVLYKPKDIVSGDFYWVAENENRIYIAAVDCTGHGVPGALMSIIGFDLLRNITINQGLTKPSEILNYLNVGVVEALAMNENDEVVNDGMDLALCVIDRSRNHIEYAGAFNPLFIVREEKIHEVKADRFSIGADEIENVQLFKNHVIEIKPNDKFYIFSDGYADQFGGPQKKKMKARKFRHNILAFSDLPMEKQKEQLNNQFDKWKDKLEQVDDVLIIGFSLDKI
jgi:ligand-binding sensor domain-containing protein/serine phosphatase RsbU (regulator of sigma subunit)